MNQKWSWVLFDICLQTLFLVDKKFLKVTAHRIIWIKCLKIDFFLKPMKIHRNHVWNMFVVICLWSIKFCGLCKTDTLLLSISSVDKWGGGCQKHVKFHILLCTTACMTQSSLKFKWIFLICISRNTFLLLIKSTFLILYINKLFGRNYFCIQNKQHGNHFIVLNNKIQYLNYYLKYYKDKANLFLSFFMCKCYCCTMHL